MPRKILVTSALPYANAPLHLGYILEAVQTDIWVRFQRMRGNDCMYCCAEDAHGTPIMIRAQQEGITPETLIARERGRAPARLRRLSDRLRSVSFDSFGREPALHARAVPAAARCAATSRAARCGRPTTSRRGMFLPDRYVRGTCPRCKSPDQYGDSCEVCGSTYTPADLIDPVSTVTGTHAGVARVGASVLPARARSSRCCASTSPAAACSRRCAPNSPSGSRPGCRTGTSRATRPTSASKCRMRPGKYFYVWFDAPIGYIASFEAWRARARRLVRRVLEIGDRHRALSLHRQGHQLLPHAVLAGGAARRRAAAPDRGVRARLSDHQRPEDVQVARHLHHRAALSGASAARAAALLLRRQARQRHRGHRLQSG